MANYIEYVNKELEGFPDSKALEQYKQKVIGEMTEKAKKLINDGIKDEQMITRLVISEYPNLADDFSKSIGKKTSKRKRAKIGQLVLLGSVAYVLILVLFFLALSFITGLWSKTWLILVCGILFPVALALASKAVKSAVAKQKISFISRVMFAFSVMLTATVLFLLLFFIGGIVKSWLLFIIAVPCMFIADTALSSISKSKFVLLNYLIAIPVCATLIYVIFGLTGIISWHPGWMLIVTAVILDVIIMLTKVFLGVKELDEDTDEDINVSSKKHN